MSAPNFVERRGLDRLPSVPGFVVRFPAWAVRPLTLVDRCRTAGIDANVLGADNRDAVGLRRLHYLPPQASEQANCIRDCLLVSVARNWLLALADAAGATGRATGARASRSIMPLEDLVGYLAGNRRRSQLDRGAPVHHRQLAAAWRKATLEARRAFVEQLTTEVRFDARGMELVIKPELRRAVAALAAPAVALEQPTLERDELGRWTEKAAGPSHVHDAAVLTCGLCWIRTSDLCDVNAAL
jgi:hypothetical protein